MSNAVDIALAALRTFDRKNDVIANNIANANTDGFKKSRADLVQTTPAGVTVSTGQVNTPGDRVTIGGEEREPSNVDAGEELIALIVNRRATEANIRTLKTTQEMQGTLLDILG